MNLEPILTQAIAQTSKSEHPASHDWIPGWLKNILSQFQLRFSAG
jgi:hypothetical protein